MRPPKLAAAAEELFLLVVIRLTCLTHVIYAGHAYMLPTLHPKKNQAVILVHVVKACIPTVLFIIYNKIQLQLTLLCLMRAYCAKRIVTTLSVYQHKIKHWH
jgi:hypothetical protein